MAVPSSPSLPERQALLWDRWLRAANGFLMLAVGLVFLLEPVCRRNPGGSFGLLSFQCCIQGWPSPGS